MMTFSSNLVITCCRAGPQVRTTDMWMCEMSFIKKLPSWQDAVCTAGAPLRFSGPPSQP